MYGKLAESIYRIVSKLHDEDDRNLVCLAKIGKSLNEDGVETFRPMYEGSKLESLIPHKFDEILYMKDGKLHTRENPYFHARDRSGKLDEQEEANLTQIITRLTGIPLLTLLPLITTKPAPVFSPLSLCP